MNNNIDAIYSCKYIENGLSREPVIFTYDWYRYLIEYLRYENYLFADFVRAIDYKEQNKHFVILRHDIDFDIEKALIMATIEQECNVISSYFFLISSCHYNIFEKCSRNSVHQIIRMGHKIGLHFDTAVYPDSSSASYLNEMCRKEVVLLSEIFGANVNAVSFHRPPAFIFNNGNQISGKFLHAYQKEYIEDITFLSDSRAMWKYGNPIHKGCIQNHDNLQILVHPIWWNYQYRDGNEILNDNIEKKNNAIIKSYKNNCQIFKYLER